MMTSVTSGAGLVLPLILRPVADVLVGGLLGALVLGLALGVVDGVALGVGDLLALLHVLSVALYCWGTKIHIAYIDITTIQGYRVNTDRQAGQTDCLISLLL